MPSKVRSFNFQQRSPSQCNTMVLSVQALVDSVGLCTSYWSNMLFLQCSKKGKTAKLYSLKRRLYIEPTLVFMQSSKMRLIMFNQLKWWTMLTTAWLVWVPLMKGLSCSVNFFYQSGCNLWALCSHYLRSGWSAPQDIEYWISSWCDCEVKTGMLVCKAIRTNTHLIWE